MYFVNLNPIQGKEQAGVRPVLVLSINAINQLPLVITLKYLKNPLETTRGLFLLSIYHRGIIYYASTNLFFLTILGKFAFKISTKSDGSCCT
ncbi:type II toxin-antitoxin system PemK/MazF family toxin [Crocosphaera sp. XPORK-15E]|uniref:type II toxin-antitoxin system PemK/MazF family toxin n=1 Tax=Crocosphaera sp. XPORK-15E TaxID=3110247 RepID=UPI002B208A85|nr:type II toxin-antitoxin system PemK/MazF family toxin [Crocosphaera sp. XPORK-15E]MEA5534035.1 type II toxin-antitoxin system PemK/MazF family toxin [Crocosphaera sp. XPORK-15E]